MRNDRALLDGDFAVYPGHPITLAYLIVCKYNSYEEAAGIPDGRPYPGALGDIDIPGAGGNVHNALDVLRRAVKEKTPIEQVFAFADETWGYCDGMAKGGNKPDDPKFGRDYYLARYNAGQKQADSVKEKLRERLATWPVTHIFKRVKVA